ncbi:SAM-dependent methyltransferase [Streptomyces sp. NPDC002215]|uniref:SAM-dependent methyltransferase n=1 Tax=Streptomyces sp. NPDC002215 TaxID=3154412 RepID=UPI00331B0DD6
MECAAQGATASTARTTHRLLGGDHHHPADRRLGESLLDAAPWFTDALKVTRRYAHETIGMLRGCGIRLFVDLGCGLPAPHRWFPHTAESAGPEAEVIHVDSDCCVVQDGPRLLATQSAQHRFVHADLRDIDRILSGMPKQPTAFLLHDVLHELDTADAHATMRSILSLAPPGSVVSVTHPTADLCRDESEAATRCFTRAGLHAHLRTAEEIRDLLLPPDSSWHLRAPGITPVSLYHPTQYRTSVPYHHSGGGYAAILLHPVAPS